MALLPKVLVMHRWEEGHVAVDGEKVAEVLRILGAEGIHGEVAAGPRIHVSVQTTLEHLHERIANWVVL